jgi:hypothetical protein
VIGVLVALLAPVGITARADEPAPCSGDPMFIDDSCIDPKFNDAYAFVEIDELRQVPVPHRFVYGGYRGTDLRFAFYFPEREKYKERFIQGPIHQLRLTSELINPQGAPNGELQTVLQFAFDSGAYVVETNNGGNESCLTARDCLTQQYDPTIRGYRANAAAAKFSKTIAVEMYGGERPNGIIYGGSGGAYMTVSSAEHTADVWAGTVPFVFGNPLAIPDFFTVRINALRVLRKRDKFPCIVDAIDPGGSGDPYESCDLNEDEAQAFREATRLGFPVQGWFNHYGMTGGALSLVAAYVPIMDPTYTEDFWNQPGYLGTEQSPSGESVRAARVVHPATVVAALPWAPAPVPAGVDPSDAYGVMGPAYNYYIVGQYLAGMPPKALVVDSMPDKSKNIEGANIVVTSGPATGKSCPLMIVKEFAEGQAGLPAALRTGEPRNVIACGGNSDPAVINAIGVGDTVRIDNSEFLALQTHHRHQVTDEIPDLYGWNQFRKGGHGPAIYPRRDVLVGPEGARQASGSVSTGKFHGKMIMVESVVDQDAIGWSGDWYRKQVAKLGLEGNYRIWFTENAIHGGVPDANRIVSYTAILQQAIRDLWAWIETDTPPPATSGYDIAGYWDEDEAQVRLEPTAAERKGVQPVVDLTVNGGKRVDITAGETVTLTATVTVPPNAGGVVATEWNFLADGECTKPNRPQPCTTYGEPVVYSGQDQTVTVTATFTYDQPGTYFPVLRATSQRADAIGTPHARIQNLGRVRVFVKPVPA